MSYEQAKKYVQALGIKTQHEFFTWRKSGERPETILPDPNKAYPEFKSWVNFLASITLQSTETSFEIGHRQKNIWHR